MNYELCNVVLKAKKEPDFKIATKKERSSLRCGDFAKLVFVADKRTGRGERMWVRVAYKSKVKKGWYMGSLANEPLVVNMKMGDKVWFNERHVQAVGLRETVKAEIVKTPQEAAENVGMTCPDHAVVACKHCLDRKAILFAGHKVPCPHCMSN